MNCVLTVYKSNRRNFRCLRVKINSFKIYVIISSCYLLSYFDRKYTEMFTIHYHQHLYNRFHNQDKHSCLIIVNWEWEVWMLIFMCSSLLFENQWWLGGYVGRKKVLASVTLSFILDRHPVQDILTLHAFSQGNRACCKSVNLLNSEVNLFISSFTTCPGQGNMEFTFWWKA